LSADYISPKHCKRSGLEEANFETIQYIEEPNFDLSQAKQAKLETTGKYQVAPAHSNTMDITCGINSTPPLSTAALQPVPKPTKRQSLCAEIKQTHTQKPTQKPWTPKTQTQRSGPWSQKEDTLLSEAVSIYGVHKSWGRVAEHVGTRDNRMCSQRWRNHLRPEAIHAKRGLWSHEEDERLRQLVVKHRSAAFPWRLISVDMQTRTSKQCQARWNKYLKPNLRTGPWTQDEDNRLVMLYRQYGDVYETKDYADALVGRTTERVRRRLKKLCQRVIQNKRADSF